MCRDARDGHRSRRKFSCVASGRTRFVLVVLMIENMVSDPVVAIAMIVVGVQSCQERVISCACRTRRREAELDWSQEMGRLTTPLTCEPRVLIVDRSCT